MPLRWTIFFFIYSLLSLVIEMQLFGITQLMELMLLPTVTFVENIATDVSQTLCVLSNIQINFWENFFSQNCRHLAVFVMLWSNLHLVHICPTTVHNEKDCVQGNAHVCVANVWPITVVVLRIAMTCSFILFGRCTSVYGLGLYWCSSYSTPKA